VPIEPITGLDVRGRGARALVVALAVAAAYVRWRPFRLEVVGGSMRPALEPGEWAIAVHARSPRRGDVLVLGHPERPAFELVKRVTATAGDLARDGRTLEGGTIWVEGDASDASTDSRAFGPVALDAVRGRVVAVFHPWRRARRVR
jgi:signal peptidase I